MKNRGFRSRHRVVLKKKGKKKKTNNKPPNFTLLKQFRYDTRSHHGNSQAADSGVLSCRGVLEWGGDCGAGVNFAGWRAVLWQKSLGAHCLNEGFNEG